jgi:steroid delta-isomerase-like uncharacterized protein
MIAPFDLNQLRMSWEGIWNRGNLETLDSILDNSYLSHHPINPVLGPEGVKQMVAAFQAAFPDLEFSIQEMIAAQDKVVVRWTMRGTHLHELMGLPATGKRAELSGISIYRFVDGKTVESWDEVDFLRLLSQLEALPESG